VFIQLVKGFNGAGTFFADSIRKDGEVLLCIQLMTGNGEKRSFAHKISMKVALLLSIWVHWPFRLGHFKSS